MNLGLHVGDLNAQHLGQRVTIRGGTPLGGHRVLDGILVGVSDYQRNTGQFTSDGTPIVGAYRMLQVQPNPDSQATHDTEFTTRSSATHPEHPGVNLPVLAPASPASTSSHTVLRWRPSSPSQVDVTGAGLVEVAASLEAEIPAHNWGAGPEALPGPRIAGVSIDKIAEWPGAVL